MALVWDAPGASVTWFTARFAASAAGPPSERSKVAVAVPVAVLVAVVVLIPHARSDVIHPPRSSEPAGAGLRSAAPWLVLVAIVVGLEAVGLALGGRSPTVPTFSTVADHALVSHASRFVIFCAWLGLGVVAGRSTRCGESG